MRGRARPRQTLQQRLERVVEVVQPSEAVAAGDEQQLADGLATVV